ncbi:MAG: hypothetical protein V3V08_20325 [Nannocystaceae bacterium]
MIGIPFTIIDAQSFGRYDLRRYNVTIVPPLRGSLRDVLGGRGESLAAWVRQGGTLIAIGGAADALASEEVGVSSVRRRRDILDDLEVYRESAGRQRAAEAEIKVDLRALWGERAPAVGPHPSAQASAPREAASGGFGSERGRGKPRRGDGAGGEGVPRSGGGGEGALARRDEWLQRFSPSGAILRTQVDTEAWIAFGCKKQLPVMFGRDTVLMARHADQVPVRFSLSGLRLSGLLWPEAAERIELGAYLVTEGVGAGQVILFADSPVFRGFFPATGRLLSNAVAYGPSLGASQPARW